VASLCSYMYEAAKELTVKIEKNDYDKKHINKNLVQIIDNKKSNLTKKEADKFSAIQKICYIGNQYPPNLEKLN
ncbi:19287_t:CDS:1, partial [Cetraspora pellucida]